MHVTDTHGAELPLISSDDGFIFSIPDPGCIVNGEFTADCDGNIFNISAPFSFDASKCRDVNYVTDNVFDFRRRIKDSDTLYHYLRGVLTLMEPNTAMFWGVVSVLSFRVAEYPDEREDVGKYLVRIRHEALESSYHHRLNPVGLRWWISSGATLVPLAEIYSMRIEAVEICKDIYDKSNLC